MAEDDHHKAQKILLDLMRVCRKHGITEMTAQSESEYHGADLQMECDGFDLDDVYITGAFASAVLCPRGAPSYGFSVSYDGTDDDGEPVHHRAKLMPSDIRTIRRRAAAGDNQQDIANDYRVSQATISHIVRRKTWAHIT